jgi:hypothetical protein
MRVRLWLMCLLPIACAPEPVHVSPPSGGYSYMVSPSGRRFRILRAGPMLRGVGTSLGGNVAYVSETNQPLEVARDADTLVAAFGPEMQLAGESSLSVEPRFASAAPVQPKLSFALKQGRWSRAGELGEVPLDGAAVPEDLVFPYDAAKLSAAATAATSWLGLLDDDAIEAAVGGMNEEFRGQVRGAPDRWLGVLSQRKKLGVPERHRELYRMQTPNRDRAQTPGDTALLEYESQGTGNSRVLERIIMVRVQPRGWFTGGYAFAPIPAR